MPFRNRIQFHPGIVAVLLFAIGLFGSHERPAHGASTPDDRAAFCKGGAMLAPLHGRDSRQIARKTPGPGVPLMDLYPGDAFAGAGDFRSENVALPEDGIATLRPGRGFRGRAPPVRA